MQLRMLQCPASGLATRNAPHMPRPGTECVCSDAVPEGCPGTTPSWACERSCIPSQTSVHTVKFAVALAFVGSHEHNAISPQWPDWHRGGASADRVVVAVKQGGTGLRRQRMHAWRA